MMDGKCSFARSLVGSKAGQAWQIAAALIALTCLGGLGRTVAAQSTGRLQVAATVVPVAAAVEALDGVRILLDADSLQSGWQTPLVTIVQAVPSEVEERHATGARILTVNYLAN